jgi:RecA-family ATPase
MRGNNRGASARIEIDREIEAARPRPYTVTVLDEMAEQARPYVVQRTIEESSVVATVGAPNVGKTLFAIDLGLHVAANATWFGLKVAGGPVVYFAAEAPGSVVMRARAAERQKFQRRLAFYIAPAAPGLGGEASSAGDAERVIATIREVESIEGLSVKLIMIDTLASCLGDGDENSDGMIRLVGAAKHIAKITCAAVMVVHHPSKADGAGLRGHGSLAAAVDTIFAIAVDELTGLRTATLTKSRDSATGLQLAYELEVVTLPEPDCFGDARTTIIVRATDATQRRVRPKGAAQEKLLTELERRHRAGEIAWDEATIREAGRGIGLHRNSASKALSGLHQGGFLRGSPAHLVLVYPPEDCT